MTSLPHLAALAWDVRDRLRAVDLGGGGTVNFVHDAAGHRIRKVVRRQNGTKLRERISIGAVEILREYAGDGTTVTLERQTLLPQPGRPAHVESRTVGTDAGAARLVRHQVPDLLGSISVELDAAAQVISYEEYHPFGSTSYQAVRAKTETPKRYRFNGKERDDETGLADHGARCYAPWLGRWTAVDPAGLLDGVNVYVYARNNPVSNADATGHDGLAAAFAGKSEFQERHTTYPHLNAYLATGRNDFYIVNADGTVTASVWERTSDAVITPGKPPPKPAPAPPKRKATAPAKEAPVDVKDLLRIANAALPHYRYAKPVRQFFGGVQFVSGGAEAVFGGVVAVWTSPTIAGAAAGVAVGLHGVDQASSGWTTMMTGEDSKTYVFRGGAALGEALGGKEWAQFGGQFAETGVGAGVGALGMWQMAQPMTFNPKLPPMPEPITELEYIMIHERPGSTVAMGQYGPYADSGLTLGEHYWMRQALDRGARTLGTTDAVPKWIRSVGPEAIVWWEKSYLMEAEHIYFFRTGFESPTATPITWMELEMIAADPALAAKTTHVPLLHNPLIRPTPPKAPVAP
jgi:RHS repeat-associated protein